MISIFSQKVTDFPKNTRAGYTNVIWPWHSHSFEFYYDHDRKHCTYQYFSKLYITSP